MPVLQSRAQVRHQARQEAQSQSHQQPQPQQQQQQQPQPEAQSPPPQQTLAFLNRSPLPQTQPTFIAIPSTYNNLANSPSPGIVIGVILGTLIGTLLLLFLLCSALGFGPAARILSRSRAHAQSISNASNTTNTNLPSTRTGRTRRRSRNGREKHEVRTTKKRRRHLRPERSAAGRNPGPGTGPVPVVPPRVFRDDGTLDEVVVIEEHSPPPRRGRSSRGARR
ncbi:hypothetical protein E4U56_001095 [Claviceps arundinis]|uniref:Uncharacterized protein n=1 Tax=Claviceps arundinis TaxID=1623583 RepID=A0A9P7MZV2_9HYPO|nr:hypothetical protein E4U56_001095 [Claviceps arundinis]